MTTEIKGGLLAQAVFTPGPYELVAPSFLSLLEPLEQDGQLGVPGLATLNAPRAALAKAEGRSAPTAPPGPAAAAPQETP